MIPTQRALGGMMDIPVAEISESPAENRIREEILNGAAHEPDSYLVIVYLEKSQEHIAEEIDKIPEEDEEHHNTDRDYNDIMYPVAFVEAEKRYHAHHDFRSTDYCTAARAGYHHTAVEQHTDPEPAVIALYRTQESKRQGEKKKS